MAYTRQCGFLLSTPINHRLESCYNQNQTILVSNLAPIHHPNILHRFSIARFRFDRFLYTIQIIARSLNGLSIESGDDLQKVLKVSMFTSPESAMQRLE
ncbi:hypothetical protein L1987_64225 [Smallanthus sonchifolius]|uniref:Uncharacterized protein n=1 Tax=Smallanthus sonchifolius TaxID=185202 RepID=A0ACB9CFR3_9ASTR|nr:hypothetical protein L1987_64225 [Smallanthus sonchifolius]